MRKWGVTKKRYLTVQGGNGQIAQSKAEPSHRTRIKLISEQEENRISGGTATSSIPGRSKIQIQFLSSLGNSDEKYLIAASDFHIYAIIPPSPPGSPFPASLFYFIFPNSSNSPTSSLTNPPSSSSSTSIPSTTTRSEEHTSELHSH